MTQPEIHVHADLEGLSRAAANHFVKLAEQQIARTGKFFAALSGGSTPRRLYELLGSSYPKQVDWTKVHLFQVDERAVPPDHPSSNFRMIRESLMTTAAIPAEHFHRMTGELEPGMAAERYAKDLEVAIPDRAQGFPRFDLLLLGMGPDGHVASIFPGSPLLGEEARWVAVSEAGPEGLRRITLTLPVLNAAALIIFLVSGVEKSETLARALGAPKTQDLLPVEWVLRGGGRTCWYVDQAAARGLKLG